MKHETALRMVEDFKVSLREVLNSQAADSSLDVLKTNVENIMPVFKESDNPLFYCSISNCASTRSSSELLLVNN